jgi:hypothetical protein
MPVIKVMGSDGKVVEYNDAKFAEGQMKVAYWTTDRKQVVLWYRQRPDGAALERLNSITGAYREQIFDNPSGDYWKEMFCWPTAVLRNNDRIGIVVPAYAPNFLFEYGSSGNDRMGIKGQGKSGKWFTAPKLRARTLDTRELGDWLNYLKVCLKVARATHRLHAAGLAHSDLSYNNVLVDPRTGGACIIDLDGLVVPQKFPPDVVGTPDFIAPEVVMTTHLDRNDPARKLPQRETDLHALAVLIYMYLLYRHPLRGSKNHDSDDQMRDESLTMGERALFVEHGTDRSNRISTKYAHSFELPWIDCDRLPYTVTGPYLSPLFKDAFENGLHQPARRPTALDWQNALIKTIDLVQPCRNASCEQKWFVFSNTTRPRCPFCGSAFTGMLPILNLYSSRGGGNFKPDGHRLMVWDGQSLYRWHTNAFISPSDKVAKEDRKRVGYFQLHQGKWLLVNQGLPDLAVVGMGAHAVPIGQHVELTDNLQILFERTDGGRLALVQVVLA